MALEIQGMDELKKDIQRLADGLTDEQAVSAALKAGAQPIFRQMKQNASTDPKKLTGNLYRSIRIGRVSERKPRGKRGAWRRITIGTHKAEAKLAPHAHLVEFGHGGPAPAPEHPFVRPAYDLRNGEAFEIIRAKLNEAIDKAIR